MGGRYSQGYQTFQSLTVKAFLAIRPYADQIIDTVRLMLDTGLPSFKGEPTIRRLRDRFALHLNERQAADFMMSIIRNAHENVRSTAYDEFQRVSFDPLCGEKYANFLSSSKTVCIFRMYVETSTNKTYQEYLTSRLDLETFCTVQANSGQDYGSGVIIVCVCV